MEEAVQYNVYYFETDITIKGNFKNNIDQNVLHYLAASPPDYRSSFSGSALPYSSQQQAFQMTPNKGKVILDNDNSFEIKIATPNSYVDGFSDIIIKPFIILKYNLNGQPKQIQLSLPNYIPFRSLTHPPNRDPLFYTNENELPIRTQEQIVRDSSYPSDNNIKSFWGLKPAC